MRKICYSVAMSLDGYIAGPQGEFDWIPHDPDIDFAALFSRFDTALMGRKTYEVTRQQGSAGAFPGLDVYVFSKTLKQSDSPGVTVADELEPTVSALRAAKGKDIWLFGGGELFRALLALRLVDEVQVAVMPVILGGGLPMLPPPAGLEKLRLTAHTIYKKSGTVLLTYDVERTQA